jgi:Transposase DDE domain group 1
MPKRSMWRAAQFDTLRLRLVKIAARVVEMKTMIRVHLPTSCPAREILRFALGRIPRLVTGARGREPPQKSNPPVNPQTPPATRSSVVARAEEARP